MIDFSFDDGENNVCCLKCGELWVISFTVVQIELLKMRLLRTKLVRCHAIYDLEINLNFIIRLLLNNEINYSVQLFDFIGNDLIF